MGSVNWRVSPGGAAHGKDVLCPVYPEGWTLGAAARLVSVAGGQLFGAALLNCKNPCVEPETDPCTESVPAERAPPAEADAFVFVVS